jgi:formylglycine-generating enzyme required for sulfatase activity
MATVFISSTSEDLKRYREAARDAAIGAGLLPKMMEYFVATGGPSLPECLRLVSAAGVVVVIVAHRYGWVPPDQPGGECKSITWLECEQAEHEGKRVLGFVVDSDVDWPVQLEESYRLAAAIKDGTYTPALAEEVQRNLAKLEEFKRWLSSYVRATFRNPDDLRHKIEIALREWRASAIESRHGFGSVPAQVEKPRIFISYRREDAIAYAGRIYDRLISQFGAASVFMDIDTLEPGADFVEVLQRTVASCDVFLAVVGKQWLAAKDEEGRSRLSNPEDFVALEIRAALKRRDIRVVPILVGGARMPRSTELLDEFSGFARLNALVLPDIGFHQALGRLIQSIERAEQERLAQEKAEAAQRAEQERLAQVEAEAARRAAQERLAQEKAGAARRAEQERSAQEEAEAARRAEQERSARVKADLEVAGASQKMAHIFISHARKDRPHAEVIAKALGDRGWSVWWDWNVPGRKTFRQVIQEELDDARCVIVLWSAASVTSDWVIEEAAEGAQRGILVPALIENVRPPLGFREIQAADLIGWEGDADAPAFRRLCSDIEGLIGARAEVAPALPQPGAQIKPEDGYVWIEPGESWMGATPGDAEAGADEKPRHRVRITRGFWLGETPVTVAAYKRFVAAKGSAMPPALDFNPKWSKEDHPVVGVTWDEAAAYCKWAGGRLPTEAEWEYAARGGKDGLKYPWGNEITPENANYSGSKWKGTSPVRSYPANAWGLYDMAGNVWEWVADWYDEKYYAALPPDKPVEDPHGPQSGTVRVLRGGSFFFDTWILRAAFRGRFVPDFGNNDVFFSLRPGSCPLILFPFFLLNAPKARSNFMRPILAAAAPFGEAARAG